MLFAALFTFSCLQHTNTHLSVWNGDFVDFALVASSSFSRLLFVILLLFFCAVSCFIVAVFTTFMICCTLSGHYEHYHPTVHHLVFCNKVWKVIFYRAPSIFFSRSRLDGFQLVSSHTRFPKPSNFCFRFFDCNQFSLHIEKRFCCGFQLQFKSVSRNCPLFFVECVTAGGVYKYKKKQHFETKKTSAEEL